MKKRILLLVGGFAVCFLLSIFSCDKCGPFPNKRKVVGIEWYNYKAVYSETIQNRLNFSNIENDSVFYENYSILIIPQQEAYFAQLENWNTGIFPSAYACDPILPTTDEKMDSIVIVSSIDFDAEHPAGSNLSELFDIVILDHSNVLHYEKYTLEEYFSTNPLVPDELTLILKKQPEFPSDFEFDIKYYQQGVDNNHFFEFRTDKIFIKVEE